MAQILHSPSGSGTSTWLRGLLAATLSIFAQRVPLNAASAQAVASNRAPATAALTIQTAHIRLLVTDFGREFRFFRDVLGFKPTFGKEGQNYADFDGGGLTVALFKRSLMSADVKTVEKPVQPDAQDRIALIFAVPSVDDATARLKQFGIRLVTEPHDRKDWGIRVAHFRDPDGNLIEINEELGH